MKIPVTRNFDPNNLIGYLTLRDDVAILPDSVFSLGYIVQERASDGTPVKIHVEQVSLIPDSDYLNYVQKCKDENETLKLGEKHEIFTSSHRDREGSQG